MNPVNYADSEVRRACFALGLMLSIRLHVLLYEQSLSKLLVRAIGYALALAIARWIFHATNWLRGEIAALTSFTGTLALCAGTLPCILWVRLSYCVDILNVVALLACLCTLTIPVRKQVRNCGESHLVSRSTTDLN